MKIKPGLLVVSLLLMTMPAISQDVEKNTWADSVFNRMTLREKIGQLFIIRAHSDKTRSYHNHVGRTIQNFHVGGVCFFQGGPRRQAELTNKYQDLADIPLFVAQDAEWGLGMRLDSTMSFPRQMTMGAIRENSLIYEMGKEVAQHLKRIGVNLNFAPVADVNNNPDNPVINSRSFGEDPSEVAQKASMYMYGLQDNGVIATAKHFPGHGDTDMDSHEALPVIPFSKQRLDSIELVPFKRLINDGVSAIMTAHLYIPEIQKEKKQASTLSKPVVTHLLQDSLGFEGLIITDALEMSGVTQNNELGELEVKALLAGNDILLMPVNIKKAVEKIEEAVQSGRLPQSVLDKKVRKILRFKQHYNIHRTKKINIRGIQKNLHNDFAKHNIRAIAKEAVTLVKNKNQILPLKRIDTLNIATVATGASTKQPFQKMLDRYGQHSHFQVPKKGRQQQFDSLLNRLKNHNLVIVSVHNTSSFPSQNFGISNFEKQLIDTLSKQKKVILNVFGYPYALDEFENLSELEVVVVSYQDINPLHDASAQIIYGGLGAVGTLPVSAAGHETGHGIRTPKIRMSYEHYLDVGVKKKFIDKIDSIALNGISEEAYPGCQILMAKDGKVFYDKTFGHHTYDEKIAVKPTDLYDLASVTKIAATTLSVMKLVDDSLLNIDRRLSYYLPYLRHTNKSELIIREVMAHQARLQSWIPYYVNTLVDNKPDSLIYSHKLTEAFNIRVADDLFIHRNYRHKVFDTIASSPLNDSNDYEYSDLGFYLMYQIIENLTNRPLEVYVAENFYEPLGLQTLGYLPHYRFDKKRLIPTENDKIFRHQLIQGDVHDPGAAMLGGVSGHAGLFSNARDLAVVMQMFLNGGHYGGQRYIEKETIDQFTKTQFPLNDNRRGIGFDKPIINGEDEGPTCESASSDSFGHSGFTGTYAWADPENNTVYVFLSNRVYPDASNWKLIRMDIRTKIQQVMYDAFNQYSE